MRALPAVGACAVVAVERVNARPAVFARHGRAVVYICKRKRRSAYRTLAFFQQWRLSASGPRDQGKGYVEDSENDKDWTVTHVNAPLSATRRESYRLPSIVILRQISRMGCFCYLRASPINIQSSWTEPLIVLFPIFHERNAKLLSPWEDFSQRQTIDRTCFTVGAGSASVTQTPETAARHLTHRRAQTRAVPVRTLIHTCNQKLLFRSHKSSLHGKLLNEKVFLFRCFPVWNDSGLVSPLFEFSREKWKIKPENKTRILQRLFDAVETVKHTRTVLVAYRVWLRQGTQPTKQSRTPSSSFTFLSEGKTKTRVLFLRVDFPRC